MSVRTTSDQWWKNGAIYCLDVETFLDSNGDGVGDLDGLMQRVDYLAGIDALATAAKPIENLPWGPLPGVLVCPSKPCEYSICTALTPQCLEHARPAQACGGHPGGLPRPLVTTAGGKGFGGR